LENKFRPFCEILNIEKGAYFLVLAEKKYGFATLTTKQANTRQTLFWYIFFTLYWIPIQVILVSCVITCEIGKIQALPYDVELQDDV
jgi:hypothetical protein